MPPENVALSPLDAAETPPAQSAPPPYPASLSAKARPHWDALLARSPELFSRPQNELLLVRYCETLRLHEECAQFLARAGVVFPVKDASGQVAKFRAFPQADLLARYTLLLSTLENQLGIHGVQAAEAPEVFARSIGALAEALGISARTLCTWKLKGCPVEKVSGQGYPLGPVRAWAAASGLGARAATAKAKGRDQDLLLRAKREREEIKRELDALKLDIQRGEYLRLEDVKRASVGKIDAVRNGLLWFARSLPPLLQGRSVREMETVIQEKVRDLLWRFAGAKSEDGDR